MVYDRAVFDPNYPVFGLYFRRYAPFKEFGGIDPRPFFGNAIWGNFAGDNRGPSTSLKIFTPHLQTISKMCCNLHPDGLVGPKTIKAIFTFQRFFSSELLRVDGRIDSAKYENRNITIERGNPWMTITQMHFELRQAEDTGVDYTKQIALRFPNLAFWIR